LAKIAIDLQRALIQRGRDGTAGKATRRLIAGGNGWSVADVLCTSGPDDRRFTEEHTQYSVAAVVAGTFQLRSMSGEALMVPGSLMLGNRGARFECGHDHGRGDRCAAFYFDREFFERLARDAGIRDRRPQFVASQLHPTREVSGLIAQVSAGVTGSQVTWDELALQLASAALMCATDARRPVTTPPNAMATVARAVRAIDHAPEAPHTIEVLARNAGLSPFHFLRSFARVVGLTPHQYVRQLRLRRAADRLITTSDHVLDIALDSGFGDVSNFNRAFRGEFGRSPTALRRSWRHA
jgi:AraC family transcriptional regulator